MACTYNLRTALGGSPQTGGTWSPGHPNSGDCADLINTNPQSVTITGGELGTIDASGIIAGEYEFTYVVGSAPCQGCATVTVTVEDGAFIDATLTSKTYCTDDDTDYVLFEEFFNPGTDTDGAWTGGGTSSAGYKGNGVTVGAGTPTNPQDDTFNPSDAGVGSYTFIYTVNHGDGTTPGGCTNCVQSQTITIVVTAAGNAGTDGAVTLCN